MADRIEISTVTCAALVTQANATETSVSFSAGTVTRIELRIPPGHRGLTGIAIAQAHQIVIPNSGTSWLVGEDERLDWPVQNYPDTGSWSVFTYNLTNRAHMWQIRFHINEQSKRARRSHKVPLNVQDVYLSGDRQ